MYSRLWRNQQTNDFQSGEVTKIVEFQYLTKPHIFWHWWQLNPGFNENLDFVDVTDFAFLFHSYLYTLRIWEIISINEEL